MAHNKNNVKICIIVTVDISLDKLFPGFYPLLLAKGYEVVGICADGPFTDDVCRQGVRVINIPMTRGFTPLKDLKCLWQLYAIFRQEHFDIIHYSTPKAALLSAIAGRLARCPILIYTLRGLGYNAFSGLKKLVGKFCEKIACHCAHYVIVISNSLREEVIREKLLPANRAHVLGAGSSKGVNINEFQLNVKTLFEAQKIRLRLGIDTNDIVVGYAGRMTLEKGISELIEAFRSIRQNNCRVHLLLVGDQDQRNPLPHNIVALINSEKGVQTAPFSENVASYIVAMDILVLPSYREGFGNILIEASALDRPVIATDIPGCRDAVIDGTTGLLIAPHDAKSLEKALLELIASASKRKEMGRNGRAWVEKNFDRNLVWARLINVYGQLLG
jgi:glycosyltransferase involved in cell wall biosynthesis